MYDSPVYNTPITLVTGSHHIACATISSRVDQYRYIHVLTRLGSGIKNGTALKMNGRGYSTC